MLVSMRLAKRVQAVAGKMGRKLQQGEDMAIRAVICDIGDVLLLRRGESLEARWERRVGLPKGTFLANLRQSGIVEQAYTGRLSEEQVTQAQGAMLGLSGEQLREFAREREEQSRYEVNAELVAYLTSLHPRYRLATLSNDWPGGRAYNERHYRLSQILAADLCSTPMKRA